MLVRYIMVIELQVVQFGDFKIAQRKFDLKSQV